VRAGEQASRQAAAAQGQQEGGGRAEEI